MSGLVRSQSGAVLLIGLVMLLAVVAIGLGVVTGVRYLETATEQERETNDLIRRAVIAIRGDNESSFGYLGDMGVLPPSLSDLVVAQTPAFNTATFLKVGMGWNGPYLREAEFFSGEELKDAWGESLVYETTTSGGFLATAVIRSKGPDKIANTSDDIVSETIQAQGTLKLYVWKDASENIPPTAVGRLYFSNNGAESFIDGTWVSGQPVPEDHFFFSSVPAGPHVFQLFKEKEPPIEVMVATIRIHPAIENVIKLGYTD